MIKNYIIQKTLGKGSYGIVYKVKNKDTNEIYVIKQIPLKGLSSKEISEMRQESKILSSINSDFVVKYYDSFEENNNINIVMEYCDEGDLNDFITKKKEENKLIEEDLIWKIFLKITIGLGHIHKMKILHRDLKTMNIFLKSGFQVKIGDLGVAKILLKNSFANTLIGTPYYLSPEICKEEPYNNKSDVWALGCILYELCTFKHPFEANNQGALILKIMNSSPENLNNYYSKDLKDLIYLLLEKDSRKRPSCKDILNLDFVRNKLKSLGFINYLKDFDTGKKDINHENNNFINKEKIGSKIININDINNNNNDFNIKKKENEKKIVNNINQNKNRNLIQNNFQKRKSNEIKINEIILGNNKNNFINRPASNRNPNKHILINNFFINEEKNKYNKKLSNVLISKKNNKNIGHEKQEANNNKIGKINQFKIVLNIPDKPPKTNNNFFHKKIIFIKNNEKKLSSKNNKEKEGFKMKNNINIKKITPKFKLHDKEIKIAYNQFSDKKAIEKNDKIIIHNDDKMHNIFENIKSEKKNNDIIKYNKIIYDENNKDKNKYLIKLLNKKDKSNDNKNNTLSKNDKENCDNNFEIISNKTSKNFEKTNNNENNYLIDSISENEINNEKNKSYISSNENSKNDSEIKNDISNEFEDENVKEIKEDENQEIQDSKEFK